MDIHSLLIELEPSLAQVIALYHVKTFSLRKGYKPLHRLDYFSSTHTTILLTASIYPDHPPTAMAFTEFYYNQAQSLGLRMPIITSQCALR